MQETKSKKARVRKIKYIPLRYVLAMSITVLEILAIMSIVIASCYYLPYFYITAVIVQVVCVVRLVASDDNPDYKVPWLLCILVLPIVGFMLYFIFSSRKLKRKYVKRLKEMINKSYEKSDERVLAELSNDSITAANQARVLMKLSGAHLFENTKAEYFPNGKAMMERLLLDLEKAEKFIFMEYFIIEKGVFWDSVLSVLKQKMKEGVEIKIVFDDIGCMTTLPESYARRLKAIGISATPFSRLRGGADSEFNNRSHRKMTIIDGYIGYTGGINLADEYIGEKVRFGEWKDTAIRIEGECVWELTKLFVIDYGINVKYEPAFKHELYPKVSGEKTNGYVVPFGDGPKPLYPRGVGKSVIQNMLSAATEYVYITTPYLIIDNDLCQDIENTALRGVDVRILVPGIPDKKLVYEITGSFYNRLICAGVKIYEYTPGFLHAKTYLVDGKYAMLGTINLDYRSLVHHFENAVWMYKVDCIEDIEKDFDQTLNKCRLVTEEKVNVFRRFIRSLMRIFAPLF